MLGEPVGHARRRAPLGPGRARGNARGRHAGRACPPQRRRVGDVGADGHDLDPAVAVDLVEERLEVRAGARGEHPDPAERVRHPRRELGEAPAGRAQAPVGEQGVDAAEDLVAARGGRRCRSRAGRRRRGRGSRASARRAGSPPSACAPRPGVRCVTTSTMAESRSPSATAARPARPRRRDRRRPAAPRGSQTSQHGPLDTGGAGSPKWLRIVARRQRCPRRSARSCGTGASAPARPRWRRCGRGRASAGRTAPAHARPRDPAAPAPAAARRPGPGARAPRARCRRRGRRRGPAPDRHVVAPVGVGRALDDAGDASNAPSSSRARSMKNTCSPLSRGLANSSARACSPSRPARPASW